MIFSSQKRSFVNLAASTVLFIFSSFFLYSLKFLCPPNPCSTLPHANIIRNEYELALPTPATQNPETRTELRHIAFGIGSSAKLWNDRKKYVRLWWRPREMRGAVWLDRPAAGKAPDDGKDSLPLVKISGDTSWFKHAHRNGSRSGMRISRIVSDTLRLGLEDVRWFVMGDDDTFFVADNLVRVLEKYDHNQFYYIGSSSESHKQNLLFSYGMAYGGGGFAISCALAVALEKIQDRCIQKYPDLYGSDDRIQACMAELGVPLTKEFGFHQCDVQGNLYGLLAAHPVTPFVSVHHMDLVEPIFPRMGRVEALEKLAAPMKLDSAALMQQSICYDRSRSWTVSVSWGYSVQIVRGIVSPREMEKPSRTFLSWHHLPNSAEFTFNSRSALPNRCQTPFVHLLSSATFDDRNNMTVSEYARHDGIPKLGCEWKMSDPSQIQKVKVYKKPDPFVWDKARRRNCCRVLPRKKEGTMVIDVGVCREGEIIGW